MQARFRVAKFIPPAADSTALGASSASFCAHDDHRTRTPQQGSLDHDLNSGAFNYRWETWKEFEAWRIDEETTKCIELRHRYRQSATSYTAKFRLVCSRQGTGGTKKYIKKHLNRRTKIHPKRTNCPCRLTVKTYPGVSTVLGKYYGDHNHDIGATNLPFTRIPKVIREWICGMLRLHVAPEHILQDLHSGAYKSKIGQYTAAVAARSDFIELRDIYRMQKGILAETIRLHPDDAQSTLLWVAQLKKEDSLLGFKAKSDLPPPGSGLDSDVFTLMIQTPWQRETYARHGEHILCIDATHNVSMYENMLLTTLIVRDRWAHGIPVGWMLASNGTQATIQYFLKLHHQRNPVIPRYIMTDFDWAQINACRAIYTTAWVWLCWWHVLHAWRKHVDTKRQPELWLLLCTWIRITDQAEFDTTWDKIKALASPKLIEYLTTYYMANEVIRMWSAIYRKARSILEACNTNMLVEAWHHVLKGKFLKHKRNHRIDQLLHTLVHEVIPYYSLRQRRQDGGFEGQDVEMAKRAEIETEGATYVKEDIEHVHKELYLVISKSQSRSEHQYQVDIATYTCTCSEFPLIKYCKHIAAVQRLFEEVSPSLPILSHCESVQQDSDSSANELTPSSSANSSMTSTTNPAASATIPQPPTLTQVAIKLERAAARMRRPGLKPSAVKSLDQLNSRLDAILEETDDSGVFPSSQGIRRNTNDWRETKARVMPEVKTTKAAKKRRVAAAEATRKKVKPNETVQLAKPPSQPAPSFLPAPHTYQASYGAAVPQNLPAPSLNNPYYMYYPNYPFTYTYGQRM